MRDKIIAIGLLTKRDLSLLGPAFDRAWPLDQAPRFDDLLKKIDEAEARYRAGKARHRVGAEPIDG